MDSRWLFPQKARGHVDFACGTAIILSALAWGAPARAQLIDPNNRCVYQPGSTVCQPLQQKPQAPPVSGPPYEQFAGIATRSGIDLRLHPTYTTDYFDSRVRLYCSMLSQGDLMKITREVTFPPVLHMTESPKDRDRLEVAILRVGTASTCPSYWAQEQQLEGTIVR
jgi:hypothetical protein